MGKVIHSIRFYVEMWHLLAFEVNAHSAQQAVTKSTLHVLQQQTRFPNTTLAHSQDLKGQVKLLIASHCYTMREIDE